MALPPEGLHSLYRPEGASDEDCDIEYVKSALIIDALVTPKSCCHRGCGNNTATRMGNEHRLMGADISRWSVSQGPSMALPILDRLIISFGSSATRQGTSALEIYGRADVCGKFSF